MPQNVPPRIDATPLPGVWLVQPRVFQDERGYFFESFNPELAARLDVGEPFVQENVSGSKRNVLRGLHYQIPPRAQGKLVRVVQGEVFDVVADLRAGSPTFGRWHGVRLSVENRLRLWIPPGLAHGFCVLSEFAEFVYSVTAPYSPEHERTIAADDPDLAIAWPVPPRDCIISAKDRAGRSFQEADKPFRYSSAR